MRAFCVRIYSEIHFKGKNMHTERANAKINAYLNIQSRREDGYHNIVSVMQTISLCDLVTVDFQPALQSRITLTVSGNAELPADCRNLAWRAAERFLQYTHLMGVVQIMIQKHIPMSAGLAGGSADAAAVLRALNQVCGKPLSTKTLCEIGLSLGADVPFCIRGGTMLSSGVGEQLERIPEMPSCTLVVAIGEAGVSTPQAYAALDEKYNFFAIPNTQSSNVNELIDLWQNGELSASCAYFYNIFEDVIAEQNHDVAVIKRVMRESGATRSLMSGSGPSVFGVFATQSEAENAYLSLQEKGFQVFICHPCGKYTD